MQELNNFRCEKKFVISEMDYYEIESLIKYNPLIFSEIFYERNVNNIYLDSLNFKNYYENIAGNSERLKIRIRWYGNMFGIIKKPILELKIKKNELGKKLSFPLKLFIFDKTFSFKLLQKKFLESNLPEWLIEKLKLYQPTLLNSYKRRYFLSANKKYRITVDKNLVFYKIRAKNNPFKYKIKNKELYVLEIKYSSKNYEKAHHITQYFPFRLTAYSKYISGINLLGL